MLRIWRCVVATIDERGRERLRHLLANTKRIILRFWKRKRKRILRRGRGGITLLVLAFLITLVIPPVTQTRIEEIPQIFHKTKATMSEKGRNKSIALEYSRIAFGYTARERACLLSLWTRESRFDHLAKNPTSTAFGIAQLLGEQDRDPRIQILRGLRYIETRYGSRGSCRALAFHNRRGWY